MDVILADYELASNCSSVSSERARMYCGRRFSERPYDSPRLENVRASTTAERKKPLLITHAKTLVNGRSQVEPNAICRDKAFEKSRYEARRKFFENLERQQSLTTDLVVLSKAKTTSSNNRKDESIFQRNSTVGLNKKPYVHHAKLFDAPLINASTKGHVKNLNGEIQSSNNVAMHFVTWTNIAQPSFVKRVNVKETRPSSHNIVSCTNGDSQIEEEIGHRERSNAECPTIETVASIKTESLITCEDKSDSTIGMSNEQQQHTLITTTATNTEVTLARSCAETFQCDKSDNEENSPLSDLSSNNCDGRSIDRYECDQDKEASADKEINGELKSTVELKKQNVRSWIESSMCESTWPNNEEADSYELYCNDITKIVESIDVNIASSRTELDALPDTDTCVKYNLDSTNMSLIYSLTPPAAVEDESGNDDTSRDLAERSSEWQSDSTRSDNDEPLSDYIWIEPTTKTECIKSTRGRRSLSDSSSYAEMEQPVSERHSASGSDILELPSCTIRELKDIDGEVFLNGINESANEIIADLNASDEAPLSYDALEIAQQIIAEIIESIYVLLLLDSSIYDLGIVREIVRNLIDGYRREYSLVESTDQAHMSNVIATLSNDVDSICRMKGFLGNLSDFNDCNNRDCKKGVHEMEDRESSAVIEFCTVAKTLPIVAIDDNALELNFRIIKVSTDEYADMSPNVYRILDKDLIDDDHRIKIGKAKGGESAAMIKSEMETWPCDRCTYCREEDESIKEKVSCLTPISEEPDDAPREAVDSVASALKHPDDEPLRHLEACDIVKETTAANAARKSVSLDDTYTISDVSSVGISDNDEMNELEERCDVWDSSIDCMSYSYDTKEFMRLEKALADNSRLSA